MVNHWMPYFTHKVNLRRFFGKFIENHFKFELSIFIYAKTNKYDTMPN